MDTTISKQLLDSIKTENYQLKKANKEFAYHYRILTNLKLIDTTQQANDSVVITYLSKDGLLLKRIIKKYRSQNCQAYETEEFFNEKGLSEYLEYWKCYCISQKDVAEDEIIFQKVLSRKERFVYDSIGRVTVRVFIYSSMMPGPRRYEYEYDSNGKATFQMKRISENEFWDSPYLPLTGVLPIVGLDVGAIGCISLSVLVRAEGTLLNIRINFSSLNK